jgi:hypothetical protein
MRLIGGEGDLRSGTVRTPTWVAASAKWARERHVGLVDNIMNGGQAIRTRIRVKHSVGAATLLGSHERE